MNKTISAVIVMLAAAVVLLSGAVLYFSRCQCQCCGFGNQMNMRMPCPMEQQRSMPGQMPAVFGPGGMSPVGQQGPSQRGPGMGRRHGMGQQGGPGMREQQGQGQQFGPAMADDQGQSQQPVPAMGGGQEPDQPGSSLQISRMMREATQEARNYFKSQKRKPEHQEMLAKVKELMIQKMNAQGIAKDVQQRVLSDMDQKEPPQQPQPRE
jgi:hypothetical protein